MKLEQKIALKKTWTCIPFLDIWDMSKPHEIGIKKEAS